MTSQRTRAIPSMKLTPLAAAVLFAVLLAAAHPAQAQTETVLYNFTAGTGGWNPLSNLTFHGGNLYGTTQLGGSGYGSGLGTVFELSPNGSGGWNETVLYSFCSQGGANCTDGEFPNGPVIFDNAGNLYGTTTEGGTDCPPFTTGCGVVFELNPMGAGWKETVLYSFGPNGVFPTGGLILDAAGNLYGTTSGGGIGAGTVFELSPSAGGWTEQVLYNLDTSGALAIDAAGNLFGVGNSDQTGQRTVFELSPNGKGGWNSTVLYTFSSGSSFALWSGPSVDLAGNIYGTQTGWYYVYTKPMEFYGTVYKLSPSETGWTKQDIFTFTAADSASEGNAPSGGLTFDAAGNIYGTTIQGGAYGLGTVFELVPPVGKGKYEEKVLFNFNGTGGSQPYGSPILDSSGNLYGTTTEGGASEAGVVFEVTPSAAAVSTTTTLTSSPNPSIYGQAVTFIATVSSSLGAPPNGETVTFKQGSTVLGTGTLSGGSADFSTSALAVGTRSINAIYAGDATFDSSTSKTVQQVVSKAASTVALTSSQNPSTLDQPVTFTATVAPQFGGTPSGSVTFSNGNETLAVVALSGGVASHTTPNLTVGTHTITATYNGSSDLSTSSASLTQTVQESGTQEQSHTVLTTSESPSLVGQPVTFTATVASKSGSIPNGELVTFKIGNTVIGTGTTAGGIAAFTTSSLKASEYDVAATYAGDAVFASSTGTVHQTVQLAPTATSLSSSPNPSTNGQTVTFTAQVTTTGPSVPTGVIVFQGTSRDGRTEPLIAGVATLTMPLFSTSSVTANYVGDGSNAKSVSPAVDQVVGPLFPTTTTLTSSLNPSTYQQTVFLTATVTSGASVPPSGTVRFRGAGGVDVNAILTNGVAVLGSAKMDPGDHTLTAHYVAQSPWGESESQPLLQIVNRAPTTTTLVSSPNPALFGQPVTITASVAPPAGDSGPTAGEVTFFAGGKQIGERPVSNPVIQATTLPAGSTTITASYNGTELFSGSVGTLAQTVNPLSTTTTVTSSKNPSRQGENVTFVATVTATSRYVPQGTVTFTAGAATLGTVGLNGTAARLTNSTLPVGPTTVTATYNGNADFTGSSGMMTQTVGP
jgi:uncharacterized repeat protein (TIGR03803 family)